MVDGTNDWTGDDHLVVPRARNIGSGTRVDFHEFVGIDPAKEEATITATGLPRLEHNAYVVEAIKANDYQIGYIAAGYIEPGLKVLTVDGFDRTHPDYPMGRLLYMLTLCNARADDFINYMFTADGQAHVVAAGFGAVDTVVPMIPDWDVNKDGTVNTIDVVGPIRANWGESSTHKGWIRADVNNDGTVNTIDVVGPIRANWGWTAP